MNKGHKLNCEFKLKDCLCGEIKKNGDKIIDFEKLCKNTGNIVDLFTSLSLTGVLFNDEKWQIKDIYIISSNQIEKLKEKDFKRKVKLYNISIKSKNDISLYQILGKLKIDQTKMIKQYLEIYLSKDYGYKAKIDNVHFYKRFIIRIIACCELILEEHKIKMEKISLIISILAIIFSIISIVVSAL